MKLLTSIYLISPVMVGRGKKEKKHECTDIIGKH